MQNTHWAFLCDVFAVIYLAKAFIIYLFYPPHKWDGNEFVLSLPLALANG